MKITKDAVKKLIGRSQSKLDAVHFSQLESIQDRTRIANQLKHDIERKVRQNKDLTIIIVE